MKRAQKPDAAKHLGNERSDVAVFVLHRFHDAFDGTGLNFQAFPGKPVQRRNFIVPAETHVQCTAKNIRQMNNRRFHGEPAGSTGLVMVGNCLHQLCR